MVSVHKSSKASLSSYRPDFLSILPVLDLIIKNKKRNGIHGVENRASEVSLRSWLDLQIERNQKGCWLGCCECFTYLYKPVSEGCFLLP